MWGALVTQIKHQLVPCNSFGCDECISMIDEYYFIACLIRSRFTGDGQSFDFIRLLSFDRLRGNELTRIWMHQYATSGIAERQPIDKFRRQFFFCFIDWIIKVRAAIILPSVAMKLIEWYLIKHFDNLYLKQFIDCH